MAFQSAVAFAMGFGIPGELQYDGPLRAMPWQLISAPQPNVVGSTAYTIVSPMSDLVTGVAMAGGTGEFAGILSDPKVYANYGNGGVGGAFNPTMTLPDDTIAELVMMGQLLVTLTTASNPGDRVTFNTTTGALASMPKVSSYTGAISGTTLTVTGTPTGAISVGSAVSGAGVQPGTLVTALGTGSGGAGTYTVNNTQTVASGPLTSPTLPPSGFAIIPTARTVMRATAANGLAIIELTD